MARSRLSVWDKRRIAAQRSWMKRRKFDEQSLKFAAMNVARRTKRIKDEDMAPGHIEPSGSKPTAWLHGHIILRGLADRLPRDLITRILHGDHALPVDWFDVPPSSRQNGGE